jgi:transposase
MSSRKYTSEFKEEAIKLVTNEGYSRAEAGRSLGVSDKNISRWLLAFNKPKKSPNIPTASEELINLRKENRRLKLEREILKKAAAFFASERA